MTCWITAVCEMVGGSIDIDRICSRYDLLIEVNSYIVLILGNCNIPELGKSAW